MRRATAVFMTLFLAGALAPGATAGHGPRSGGGAVQIRAGGFFPSGGSQVWDDNQAIFTLAPSDLNNGMVGLSVLRSFGSSVELGFNADYFNGSSLSAYRDVVDGGGNPIFHDTRLTLVPLTLDLRIRPGGRRGPAPSIYFGAGVGLVRWNYEESGEFVDFTDDSIFAGQFSETGVAAETHVLAGVEIPISPGAGFLVEGRYTWADDQLNSADFPDFGRLNLGGGSLFAGVSFRF